MEKTVQKLSGLEERGVHHVGGHRSGMEWVDDPFIEGPGVGYWRLLEPSEERLEHERRVNTRLREILS